MRFVTVMIVLLGLSVSCERGSAARIVVTGSSTVAPLMAEVGKAFERKHPEVRVDVQTGGSSRGITDVREATADVGMVSRELREAESDLVGHPIARDGIAIIVHADNPVKALRHADIVRIYETDGVRWDEFGGVAEPVTVVHKAEGRSTLELFLHHFELANPDVSADVVIGDNEQGVKTVAGDPRAIGYVSIGTAEYAAANGVPIRAQPLDGVPATTEAVQRGEYPLSRTLNLVTKAAPNGVVADLIQFAQSPEADELVRAQFFVPLSR